MKYFLTSFAILLSVTVSAQSPCPCCTPEHRAFGFWAGDWDVFNPKQEKVGENRISYQQDSCLLREDWTGKNQTGTSYTYFDPSDSTWNQLYLDPNGTILKLKGRYANGRMTLYSEPATGKSGVVYRNRIVWQQTAPGRVSQRWDIVNGRDSILYTPFDGQYIRK